MSPRQGSRPAREKWAAARTPPSSQAEIPSPVHRFAPGTAPFRSAFAISPLSTTSTVADAQALHLRIGKRLSPHPPVASTHLEVRKLSPAPQKIHANVFVRQNISVPSRTDPRRQIPRFVLPRSTTPLRQCPSARPRSKSPGSSFPENHPRERVPRGPRIPTARQALYSPSDEIRMPGNRTVPSKFYSPRAA